MTPDATYWIQTTSTDASGNATVGEAVRLTTPAAGVAEQQTASFRRGRLTGAAVVDPAGSGAVTLSGKQVGARQGTFTSGLLDAQAMVDWDRAVSSTVAPKGSAVELRVRTGSTTTPDSSWSSWKTVSGEGRVKGSSRFLQYEVVLTESGGLGGTRAPSHRFHRERWRGDPSGRDPLAAGSRWRHHLRHSSPGGHGATSPESRSAEPPPRGVSRRSVLTSVA